MRGKIALLGATAALALTVGAGSAQADHRERDRQCFNRVSKAEHKLQESIRKHGWYSRRAQNRRAELQRARAQCRNSGWNRGRDDNWWNRGRDRDRDDRWRDNRGRRDNTWNRGRDRGRWRGDNDRWRDRDNDWDRDRDRERNRRRGDNRWRRN